MKKILTILAVMTAMLLATSCGEKEKKPLDITGEWALQSIATKAVQIGSVKVDVYISFAQDGSFELYQKVGEGRYRRFDGNWSLLEDQLSGTYSDGKAWGSTYTVSMDADRLIMLSSSATPEESVYTKATIPSDVKNSIL